MSDPNREPLMVPWRSGGSEPGIVCSVCDRGFNQVKVIEGHFVCYECASLLSMNTHSSPGERPVIGLLSTVPGAQSHTRTRSLVTMKKEELIERVLLVEEHCRLIDARLHEAWREVNTLRALRDSIKVIDLGPLAPSEREELEDLRFRMKGLEK